MRKKLTLYIASTIFTAGVLFTSCGRNEPVQHNPWDAARDREKLVQTAKDAYIYGFPLVLSEVTKRYMTNPLPNTGNVPVNSIKHGRNFPNDKYDDFSRPDTDTYYSVAWLDLSKEPVLIELPSVGNKYALFSLVNAWGDAIFSGGKRTGSKAQKIAVTGPRWNGETPVPEGFTEYKSQTNTACFIARIQADNKQDGDTAVKRIQNAIKLYPMSYYGGKYSPQNGRPDDTLPSLPPLEQVLAMHISDYFNMLNQLMVGNIPYAEDAQILDKILDIGVAPGMRFDIAIVDLETQEAFKGIPKWMPEYISALSKEGSDNGWSYFSGIANYGTDYASRAKAAYLGLGPSAEEDIIYAVSKTDSDNEKYNGARNKFVLHFDKGELPPVNAFWSLSLYNEEGFFTKNQINRFSLSSKSGLKYNKDGSLDIYIQKNSPGKEKQSNWLPSPEGEFNIMLRFYWPKEELTGKKWKAPVVKKYF